MQLRQDHSRRETGIALIDMLVVVVIVGILAAYGVMKMNTTGENTLWYQAQRLARDIQHMQVLSTTYGKPLQVTATAGTNGSYSVSCVTAGSSPCDVSPIIDPTTGQPFTVSLQNNVSLAVSGTNPLPFDQFGRPLNGGALASASTTFTVTANGTSVVIAVAPVTGFVSVTP
jgi:Tfp pilus assembly protein FimT